MTSYNATAGPGWTTNGLGTIPALHGSKALYAVNAESGAVLRVGFMNQGGMLEEQYFDESGFHTFVYP